MFLFCSNLNRPTNRLASMDDIIRRLHPRGPANPGIVVDAEGVMLGPDCVLVRRTAQGYRSIARDEAVALQKCLSADTGNADWLFGQCRRIAKALDNHDVPLAQILGLYIPIDDLDGERLKRLARAAPLIKANFDPSERRVPKGDPHGGEWTTGGGGNDASLANARDADLDEVAYQGRDHDAVVAGLGDYLTKIGGTVITSVPLTAFDGTTAIADMMVKLPNRTMAILVEVKTGEDPKFTAAQAVVYPLVQLGAHVTSSDERLRAIGLTPGERLPPLEIWIYWSRVPGQPAEVFPLPPPEFVP
jgi:hypothetical protein